MRHHYWKKLSETDIRVRLSFPMKSFNEALREMGAPELPFDFKVIDSCNSQKKWKFRLSIRKDGHPKPVLSAGWLPYVRAKGLRKGDRISFCLDKDDAGKTGFRIRAQRKGPFKLFGTEFKEKEECWTDVEDLKPYSA